MLLFALVLASSTAQAQFGQNIVQYDHYEWRFIQTSYFDIYFYGDDLVLPEYVSHVTEEAYRHISDRLNWQLQKRISIMVYQSHSDFQQTNVTFIYLVEGIGGATEPFKNRIIVPFEGSFSDFHHVIRHELVHAVLNDMIFGGSIQSAVNGTIRYRIPLWMNEGLSDYLAAEWDATSDMYMRDMAINGEIPPIQQLGGLYAYHGGRAIWRYLTGKYGEEVIAEIFSQIKRRASVERGLQAATGSDYEQLNDEWQKYLKKQYWPDVAGRDRLKDVAFPVTNHLKQQNVYNAAPAISPDGSKLAILANDYQSMEIVLISATDGRFLKRLIQSGTTGEFEELHLLKPGITWSPDGSKVAFAAKAATEDRIYVKDIKTNRVEKYATGLEGVFNAVWNPLDGSIAFVGNNGTQSDIYILDLESREITNITDDVFGEFNPAWSPDGERLAFASDRGLYPPFRFDGDGIPYDFHVWVDSALKNPLSSVAPDFLREEFDFYTLGIYMLNKDGSDLRLITEEPSGENFPVFSNNAPYLYYTSNRSGINNIYMMNLETGEERAVTNIQTGIDDLNMARDDSRLYFTGFSNSGYDIYRIHNPLTLWDQPREIEPSQFVKADISTKDMALVNTDRPETAGMLSTYSRYVFGVDDPVVFSPTGTDSTERVLLDDSSIKDAEGEYMVHPYKTRFTLDLVQTYAGYSTLYSFQGMTQFMFSDMLGNHRISMSTEMQISLENSDYYLTYHLLPFRTNYYFTLFHTAFIWPTGVIVDMFQYPARVRFRHFGFDVTASQPINKFRRLEFGLTYNGVERTEFVDFVDDNYPYYEEYRTIKLPALIPRIGYVWDNAEWSYMYPVQGWRMNFSLSTSPPLKENGISFQRLTFDIRRYYRVFGGTSFAARLSGGGSFGRDAPSFLMGGLPWVFSNEENNGTRYRRPIFGDDELENLKTLYYSQYVTPLRGTQMMEEVGNRAVLLNLEYRFPFLIYYFPALRALGQLGGVLFTDS
ncbi:MAG: hypothetical protein V3W14_13585, partial [Candidatus Neomarinimicrobiota bacterium]